MTMSTALFLFVTGLTNGAIYALLGLGLVLIYNVTRVINIAQGEFVMLGALTAVGLTTGEATGGITLAILAGAAWALLVLLRRRRWSLLWLPPLGALALSWLVRVAGPYHLPPLLAVLVATVTVAFVGAALYRLTIQPAAAAGEVVFLIITTGLYLGLQGLGLLFWGPGSFSFPSVHGGQIAAGADRCPDHAAHAHAVLQSGGRSLPDGGQHGMRRVADDDDPAAHVAGAPARQLVHVVAHQLAGRGSSHDGLDPGRPSGEVRADRG